MLNRKIVKEFQNYSSFFFSTMRFIFNWNIAIRVVVTLNLVQQARRKREANQSMSIKKLYLNA